MAQSFRLRRGTAAQWTAANPVLAQGEPGYETDTGKFKIGDGVAAWGSLATAYVAKADHDADTAALVNDTTPSATRGAVDGAVKTGRNVRVRYLDDQPGVALDGLTECGTAIQNAINAAEADGVHLIFGRRTYVTATTLTFKKSADFYESTISYSGTGTAVVIGDPVNGVTRQWVRVGRVVSTAFTTGWATAGAIGVQIVDTLKSRVDIKSVTQFLTGVQMLGTARGCAYNEVHVSELHTNKVNMQQTANAAAGFCNENLIVGGSWNHDQTLSGGAGVAGTKHVLQDASGGGPVPDTNVFFKCAFEGSTAEWMVDSAGKMNTFRDCRWEAAAPKVRWNAGSYGNAIRDGYKPWLVTITNNGDVDNTATWPASGDTASIILGTEQFNVGALGTATKAHINRHPVISIATSSAVTATVQFPANWHTYDVTLHVAHDVASGTGTTTWLYRTAQASEGDSLGIPAGGTARTVTMAAQQVVKVSTLETGVAVVEPFTTINLIRDAGGTFAGNAQIVGLVLTKRS